MPQTAKQVAVSAQMQIASLSIVNLVRNVFNVQLMQLVRTTGSALATASDIHRQVPTNTDGVCRDWLTNQNTDCCFVVIGLSTRQSHSPLQQLKYIQFTNLVRHICWHLADAREYLLTSVATTVSMRIFIYIRGPESENPSNTELFKNHFSILTTLTDSNAKIASTHTHKEKYTESDRDSIHTL